MRIALITTKAAKEIVEAVVRNINDPQIKVIVLDNVPVAALATTMDIVTGLRDKVNEQCDTDLIIIPGLVRGSTKVISDEFGIEAVKGTIYAGDIPLLLDYIRKGIKLSTEEPADKIIGNYIRSMYESRLNEYLKLMKPLFKAKNVVFVKNPPPLNLFLEIMVKNKLLNNVNEYRRRILESKYQGIILGCSVYSCNEDIIEKLINEFKLGDDVLLGIDAPINYLLKLVRRFHKDIDIIMNIPPEVIANLGKDIATYMSDKVIIMPIDVNSDISEVEEAINSAETMGIDKIIIDVPLRPPMLGLSKSLCKYIYLKSKINKPLLMGLSNVYELMDVDCHGVIALLEALAFELGVSNLLLTEESAKTRGCIEEGSKAREMMYRAFLRRSPPIDLGVDILVVKSKKLEIVKPPKVEQEKIIDVREFIPPHLDERYYVKIYVNLSSNEIIVDVHNAHTNTIIKRFKGTNAMSLGRAIVKSLGLSNEHALYLGYELSKAEIALRLKKNYIQDEPLIKL